MTRISGIGPVTLERMRPFVRVDTEMTGPQAEVRGLATVALLKVNYDAGRDHIDMFLPFALDAIRSLNKDAFQLGQVSAAIRERFQLTIPDHTLSAILSRARKRGYCRRSAGHYIRELGKLQDADLAEQIRTVEREHWALAKRLREFSANTRMSIESDEQALEILLAFLDDRHVAMILDAPEGILFRSTSSALTADQTRLMARFLQMSYRSEPELTKYIRRMLEGFVLQNALLLKDIGSSPGSFKDLRVYFDSIFLLRALGLMGSNAKRASRELIELLKATAARLFVFERTIAEMKKLLRVYEEKLGSAFGIAELREGPLTQHLISERYKPSDVAEAVALMETNLRGLGLRISPFPSRVPRFTFAEEDLTQCLCRPGQNPDDRVNHDVDCTAAILTLRRLEVSRSLETTGAVFVTTSKQVVDTVTAWYKRQGNSGVPPMIRHVTMSTAAWLKKPRAAGDVKLHELIASCSVALQPSSEQWQAFTGQLKKLTESGELSSEEMVAVVASELTEIRLIERDDADYHDASTVAEMIALARKEMSAEAEAGQAKAYAARAEEQARAERAEQAVAISAEKQRQMELMLFAAATRKGKSAAATAFRIGCVILGVSGVVGLAGVGGLFGWLLAGPAALASFLGFLYGKNLKHLTERFGEWVRRRELQRILGSEAP